MKPAWFPDWSGETCIIIGAGPSAGRENLAIAKGRARVIAINESWRLAPWADVLYGCDDAFWRAKQGVPEFTGLKISQDACAVARFSHILKRVICEKNRDTLILDRLGTIGWGGNSGFQAINLAVQFGVKKIILVGYDMRLDYGMHWHGPHPKSMNNPIKKNVDRWRRVVDDAYSTLSQLGIRAVNCSPVSSLTAYPKMKLEAALVPEAQQSNVVKTRILGVSPVFASPNDLYAFHDVFAYYLQREMRSRGIELDLVQRQPNPETYFASLPLEEYDHLIGFGLRYFDKNFTKEQLAPIKKRVKGAVVQFADGPREHSIADVCFTCKGIPPERVGRRFAPFHIIGWAADPETCLSQQDKGGTLRILLDHYDYDPKRLKDDLTDDILKQIEEFKHSDIPARAGYKGVEVKMLTSPKGGDQRIPFFAMAREYGKAHIFINGHRESVGLCVMEAAVSGCLVVSPQGYIPDELLRDVRRITFDHKVPWQKVLSKINPAASRERAKLQTWSMVCDRILAWLRDFKK